MLFACKFGRICYINAIYKFFPMVTRTPFPRLLSVLEAKLRPGRYFKDLITSEQFITMLRGAITIWCRVWRVCF